MKGTYRSFSCSQFYVLLCVTASLQAGKETGAMWELLFICPEVYILHNGSKQCKEGTFLIGVHFMNREIAYTQSQDRAHECLLKIGIIIVLPKGKKNPKVTQLHTYLTWAYSNELIDFLNNTCEVLLQ